MAIAAVTRTTIGTYAFRYTWAPMANGDTGAVVDISDLPDATFQVVTSTFGAGGTVVLEGSVGGAPDYFPLKDPSGAAISLTAAGGRALVEHPSSVRPRISAGDGTTAINCVLFARRAGR